MSKGGIGAALIIATALLCCRAAPAAQTLWLVIGATGKALAPMMQREAELSQQWHETMLVRSADCRNLQPDLSMVVIGHFAARTDAEQLLQQLQKVVTDGYVRNCEVTDGSLLSFGIPLVDASIRAVPKTAVNWSDADRVSEIQPADGGFLLVKRIYDSQDQGWREGRQQDLYFLFKKGDQPALLRRDCWDIGTVASTDKLLAFQCATEVAADTYLHKSVVFDVRSMRPVTEEPSCRNPQFEGEDGASCEHESVDADGKLHLTKKRLVLSHRQ